MDLGSLGPKESTVITYHWNPAWHLIAMAPYFAVAALALLRWNRNRAAWLAALPPAGYALAELGRQITPYMTNYFYYLRWWPEILPLAWLSLTSAFLAGGWMSAAGPRRAWFGGATGLIFGWTAAFVALIGLSNFDELGASAVLIVLIYVLISAIFVAAFVIANVVTALWARGDRRILPRYLPVFLFVLFGLIGAGSVMSNLAVDPLFFGYDAIISVSLANMVILAPFIVLAPVCAVNRRKHKHHNV